MLSAFIFSFKFEHSVSHINFIPVRVYFFVVKVFIFNVLDLLVGRKGIEPNPAFFAQAALGPAVSLTAYIPIKYH
jgi:hypothetical protein